MPEHTEASMSEGRSTNMSTDVTKSGDTTVRDTAQGGTPDAATVVSQAHTESVGSFSMDIHLTTSMNWVREFKESSPSRRAVMLSQVMDLFNDGQEGIYLSFSEPEIHDA